MNTEFNLPKSIRTQNVIAHTDFRTALNLIDRCREVSKRRDSPHCLALLGLPRMGKTTIVGNYVKQNPPKSTPTGKEYPVVYASTPPTSTTRTLANALSRAFGDPLGYRSQSNSAERIIDMLKRVKAELLILDEFQHLRSKNSPAAYRHVADWLKEVIKQSNVPCIAVGLPDGVRSLTMDSELGGIFDEFELKPFALDKTFERYVEMLLGIENIGLSTCLGKQEWLTRLHYSTMGRPGFINHVIEWVSDTASLDGADVITLKMMRKAYNERRLMPLRVLENPFATAPTKAFKLPRKRGWRK